MKHIHFPNRAVAVLLSSLLLLILCACSQNGVVSNGPASSAPSPNSQNGSVSSAPASFAPSSDEPASSQTSSKKSLQPSSNPSVAKKQASSVKSTSERYTMPDTSPLSAYQSVLQNKAKFFSTDANKNLNINQLNQAVSNDSSVTAKATKLAIVDLENDGPPEVILWLSVNNNNYYGFEVLRYQDGVVYVYTLWYRAFMDLKADGTFSFSSGAADHGFGTVKFTKNAYSVDKISYCESGYDFNNNQSISYFVDHKSATQDDFLSAINKQSGKTGVTWYDFTDDNIETMLSNFK